MPELPPIPLAEKIEQLQNVPSFMGYAVLVVADENSHEFVALAEIAIPKTEENQHLAQFMIQVLPAYRCKGYGRSHSIMGPNLLRKTAVICSSPTVTAMSPLGLPF